MWWVSWQGTDPTSSTTRSVPRVSLITAPSPVSQPSDTVVDAVLRYDVDMGCLYLDADGLRLFAVWPPGLRGPTIPWVWTRLTAVGSPR